MKRSVNVVIAEVGLVDERFWRRDLEKYDTGLVEKLRQILWKEIPDLAEKYNHRSKYFGYRRRNASDALYVVVQKKRLKIYLRLSRDFENDLQQAGFTVKYENNFQGQAGWLTGWHVPHDWQDIGEVVKWLRLALKRN